jgi:type II secretory ATPase GspE/PulE/Tfp pilus assembly ATPase PilB-like protein
MIEQLGKILLKSGQTDNSAIQKALFLQEQRNRSGGEHVYLGEILKSEFGCSEEAISRALAEQFGIDFVSALEEKTGAEFLRELPMEFVREFRFFPVEKNETIMTVAVSDPLDLDTILSLQALTGLDISIGLTTPTELKRAMSAVFEGPSLLSQSAGLISKEYSRNALPDENSMSVEEIKKRTESEPVVKMASLIFDEALKLKASDIHIEPAETAAIIRYRIDGLLTQHMETSREMYVPLTSRIKIMADLDIAEKRVPQDGRIRYENNDEQYDFRVSTLPTHWGEKTVVRILKHDTTMLSMSKIGLGERELQALSECIEKPQGMVFVTGPTGSGKSSTLFAALNAIRAKAINITTIEDPIEYKIEGLNQVQINERAGVTFASTLRSILRQDPDVILVGEIRDRETAEIAMQASQTGHLVFSTLHTNDAISAITRLKDLGIPGFLISSSLLAILAQRLVRLLCANCKQKGPAPEDVKARWRTLLADTPLPESFRPVGCQACHGLGYKGRVGIFELVTVSDAVRDLIAENAAENKIRRYLRSIGMKTLIQNGIDKIDYGITTPEELLRVVMVEDIVKMKEIDS